VGAALTGLMLSSSLSFAQTVVPSTEATRFIESDCQWLHRDFLAACIVSETCGSHPDELSYSTALQRRMSSLETVITVAAMHEIDAACNRSCKSKHLMDYSTLRQAVCLPLMERPKLNGPRHHRRRTRHHQAAPSSDARSTN
jgi:hypothetical protein